MTHSADKQLSVAKRLLAVKKAREGLLDFMQLRMPDPEDPDNPESSSYIITAQAKLLAEVLEKVERGELLRVCVSIGPQLGKSEIISRGFPAWYHGRNPYKNLMLGTYNQDFANDFGGDVRQILQSPMYRQVFPDYALRKGSKAKNELKSTKNGRMAFLGRGGAGTGKPADIFIIDDPLKDDVEAQSGTIRKQLWSWFNKVAFTRCHKFSAIVIVHTRWHEDDLIGRLVDPDHPEHDPDIAKDWTYINIPAVIKDPKLAKALGLTLEMPTDKDVIDMFGAVVEQDADSGKFKREAIPMAALWADRKSLKFLSQAKRLDPRGFEALYQGNPAPEDGEYFTVSMLKGYKQHEFPSPSDLRWYAASDHAATKKEENDASVLGAFGVDAEGDIWIPPDIFWGRVETDTLVEEIISIMRRRRPMVWWAGRDNIKKGFGPFLRRRQKEEGMYIMVQDIPEVTDIRLRSRSIQGMMSLGRVHFPTFAPWWQEAKNELLKFPNATHDDFIAFLAIIGMGLDMEVGIKKKEAKNDGPKIGTLGWVKQNSEHQKKQTHLRLVNGGF